MKWNKVSDELPNNTRDVLVSDIEGSMAVGWFDTDKFIPANMAIIYDMSSFIFDLKKLTHWCELPEAPYVFEK